MSVSTEQIKELRLTLTEHLRSLRQEEARIKKLIDSLKGSEGKPRTKRVPGRPLHRVAGDGNLNLLRTQLEKGADPNQRNSQGETPLLAAAYRHDNGTVVRELLTAGADPNLADDDGNTPLIVCVRDQDIDVVRQLLDHGANVNAANREGDTPLTNAACWGSGDVVELLLSKGADPHARDGAGVTAINLARQQGHTEVAARLARR